MSTGTPNPQKACPQPNTYHSTLDLLSGGDSRNAQSQEVFSAYREEHPVPQGINPIIGGRLFTSLDANLNPEWPIIPAVGLKFGELHRDDQNQFFKCKSHQLYQDALIEFLNYAREHPKTPPPHGRLEALCQEAPSEGNVKWKCVFKGCTKPPDTLVHIKDHLLGGAHFKNKFFHCPECDRPFGLKQDCDRHIKTKHPSIRDAPSNRGAEVDYSGVRGQSTSVANGSVGISSSHAQYSTYSISTGSRSAIQSQQIGSISSERRNNVIQGQSPMVPPGIISSSLSGQTSVQPAYNPQPLAYDSTVAINEATAARTFLFPPYQPYHLNVGLPASQIDPGHDMRNMDHDTTSSYQHSETQMNQQLLRTTSVPDQGPRGRGTINPNYPGPPHATFDQQRQFTQRQFALAHQRQVSVRPQAYHHHQASTSYHQQENLPSVSDPGDVTPHPGPSTSAAFHWRPPYDYSPSA